MWDSIKGREYQRNLHHKLRAAIFASLGACCVHCGFLDKRALQIDHVNGGGHDQRVTHGYGRGYLKYILTQIKAGSTDYQILCANCNWIKRHEKNENRPCIDKPRVV